MRFLNAKYLFLFVIALTLFLHLPFLSSDPDPRSDVNTRGAWTDEGLYASQARNFITTGSLSLKENSTFIRGPLQTLIYIPLVYVFGERLIVLRLFSLLLLLVALCTLAFEAKQALLASLITLIVISQYHVFHFSHYAMAEMMCISMIILSLVFFLNYLSSKKWVHALLASLFVFIAYGFKIQYVYFAALLPIAIFFSEFFTKGNKKQALQQIALFSLLSLGFALIYVLLWALPQREFYTYVMSRETDQRFVFGVSTFFSTIWATYHNHIGLAESRLLRYSFVVCLLVLPFIFRRFNSTHKALLSFAAAWLLVESHKLFMPTYLPVRYMLSGMVAAGLLISVVVAAVLLSDSKWRVLALLVVFLSIIQNAVHYHNSYMRRSSDAATVNTYLRNYDLKGKTVLGPWAPSLCWGTAARTIPVWRDFLNSEQTLSRFSPTLVISELNEAESDEAFISQGINLMEESDSMRVFTVWRYQLGVYWIKAEE